ncbi:MAG: flagellar export protein FliJ [Gammaproteobacteria bacterium]|nr:flagellar export protein FliJ [Gammaproteobacteria bacterium]
MKRSKKMQPVANVAELREREAAIALSKAQSVLQTQVQRLQELINYHTEYQQRFQVSGMQGINAFQVQGFLSFITNLQAAVDQQKEVISKARVLVQQKKQAWVASRGKLKAIDTIIDNYRNLEQKEQDKQEQKNIDELAQRVFNPKH